MATAPQQLPRRVPLAPSARSSLAVAAAAGVLWLVTFEGGAVSNLVSESGAFLHEFFHDGRHLLGVPCH